jgi:hypothetical protein
MAGLPEDAYLSEFVITAPVEETEDEDTGADEFDIGAEMGDI